MAKTARESGLSPASKKFVEEGRLLWINIGFILFAAGMILIGVAIYTNLLVYPTTSGVEAYRAGATQVLCVIFGIAAMAAGYWVAKKASKYDCPRLW